MPTVAELAGEKLEDEIAEQLTEALQSKGYMLRNTTAMGVLTREDLDDLFGNDDPTNPNHYKQGGIEAIEAIEAATVGKSGFEGFLVGNVIKYLWRYEEKNGVEDLRKALWYLNRLEQHLAS